MYLGIDFGTTRTVVACADRGNYPVVTFRDGEGDPVEWFPSVAAARAGEIRYGFDALGVSSEPGWTLLRSFKRVLASPRGTSDPAITIGDTTVAVDALLTGFLSALRAALVSRSNLPRGARRDDLVAVVATPASAHGVQRFLTLDAFRRAGFTVKGLLNEPSAAGFEYTHRHRSTLTSRREHVIVYDLGGGTFDASLVRMSGRDHVVVLTAGDHAVGGDDFDAVLASQALAAAGIAEGSLPPRAHAALLEHCREVKERINPSTKRVVVDLSAAVGAGVEADVTISVADYFDACVPLVSRTLAAMAPVLASSDPDEALAEVAGVYVVGGASALPIVSRMLRETFGRRVHRSLHPSAAVAIGLAIACDPKAGFGLRDRLSRHFGVFRETMAGLDVVFDVLLDRDAEVPKAGAPAHARTRTYRAAHNVGRYRFAECDALGPAGVPLGHVTAYRDVLFPFDRALRAEANLASVPVRRLGADGPLIAEEYAVTSDGLVHVTITDVDTGFARVYDVGA